MKPDFAKIPSINDLLISLQSERDRIDAVYLKILVEDIVAGIKRNPEKAGLQTRTRTEIMDHIVGQVRTKIKSLTSAALYRVINATGVVLHTGLGRAPLGSSLLKNLEDLAGYTNLEIDLETGKRGDRLGHVLPLLKILSGAEDAVVTNNNAAAVLLTLHSLAKRKEVIVSRGELVEIGGSFRMPEVMKNSQAKMVEIGSTNKTHLEDYTEAITERTAAIMIVHPSNFKIIGFTQKPEAAEILEIAHRKNIPVIYDLGSGALFDMTKLGFDYEPLVSEVIREGFDVVTFSGDKLLGGPQAGIIIGRRQYLQKIRKNHLLRALRCDKLTISLLAGVLQTYLVTDKSAETNTALGLLARKPGDMKKTAGEILAGLDIGTREGITLVPVAGRVGSGAYPVFDIPGFALQFNNNKYPANQLARKFRQQSVPILGYIADDLFHLHMLTVFEEDIAQLITSINGLNR